MYLRNATNRYVPTNITRFPSRTKGILIAGETYYSVIDVLKVLRVSRQTLWNWRKRELIPAGSRLRKRVVFSATDLEAISAYAAKLEPVEFGGRRQLKLHLP
ncbi:helix-turn-helix transcriptional regulator [Lacunisphaera limnophila]|uniref:helix-turn-helix transcriptional regulator n=1 Tax=Lacunisphaera limnophila TaxID=1838286 RepID=UPI003CCDE026